MAALTKDRNTKIKSEDQGYTITGEVAVVEIFNGALLTIDTTGFARPARTTGTDVIGGLAEFAVDNTGGSAGDEEVKILRGVVAEMENDAGSLVVQANFGRDVFVLDDQTVGTASSTVVAGTFVGFDPESGKPLVKLA
jgi:hypothetical protein